MVEVIKKEINNPMWSWTARFITDKNIVLATSCENHTEIYLYSPEGLSKASKNKGINNIEDYICFILEDEDLLSKYISEGLLTLLDVIK